jgi:hypothetical protein
MSATTTTPSPTLLPDPTEDAGAAIAPGRADDLIASLADQQIDDLMNEGADRDAGADSAVEAAIDAASQLGDVTSDLLATAAVDLLAELDQIEANRVQPVIEPVIEAVGEAAGEAVATSAPEPAVDQAAEPTVEPAAEPTPEPIAAASPSFNPPPKATLEVPTKVEEPEPHAEAFETPTFETPDVEESSAEAVARELASDVALLSTPLPSVVEHDAKELARDPWWRQALASVVALPGLVLGAINLPARPLSDRGREIIGAAGIVTLVNAAGLLIYLTMFARH